MKKIIPLLVLVSFAAIAFYMLAYPMIIKVNPNRIKKDENGNEVVVLNSIEQQLVGKWFVAFDSSAVTKPMHIRKRKGSYHNFRLNGLVSHYYYDKPKGTKQWEVSMKDSILKYTNSIEQMQYSEIISITPTSFKVRCIPDAKIGRIERWMIWKKYE